MAEKQIDKISGKRVINESGFTHAGDYMVFHDDDFKYRGNDDETLGLRNLSLYQDGYAPGVTIKTKNQYMDDMGNKRRYFQDEEPDKFIYPNRKEHDTESPYYGQRRYSLDLNDDPNDNGEDSHTRKGAWYALRERQQKFQNLLKQASAELRSAGEKNVFPSEKIFAFYCNLLYYITSAKYDIVRRLSMHPKYLEATIRKIYMAAHNQNRKDRNLQSPFLMEWFRGLLDAGYESLDKLADECMGVSDKFEKAFENLENEWRGMRRGLSYFSRRSKKAASAEETLKNLVWDIEAIRSMMDAPVTAANHQGDNRQKGENPNPKLGVFADNEFSIRQAAYNQTRNTLYGNASVSNFMMHESKTNKNMKNTIKLKESDLRNIVKNAVVNVLNESMAADAAKRVIKEISINTLDNAERKSGGWDGYTRLYKDAGYGSRVHKAIDDIEEELWYYAYKTGSGQAKKLLTYLDPLRDFFNRKGKQAANFTDAREDESNAAEKELGAKAKAMFNKDIDELSGEEFDAVLSKCSPRTQEYAKIFW